MQAALVKKVVFLQSQRKNELLLHDARRRDFTVNAMYAEYQSYQIHDPLHGRKALDNRMLQMIGNMPARYVEDLCGLSERFAFRLSLSLNSKKVFLGFQKKKKVNSKGQ